MQNIYSKLAVWNIELEIDPACSSIKKKNQLKKLLSVGQLWTTNLKHKQNVNTPISSLFQNLTHSYHIDLTNFMKYSVVSQAYSVGVLSCEINELDGIPYIWEAEGSFVGKCEVYSCQWKCVVWALRCL